MIEFNPEDARTLFTDSDLKFGGFSLDLDDWTNITLDSDFLELTPQEIFESEDTERWRIGNFNSTTSYSDIILVYDANSTPYITPLYIEKREQEFVYRGREMFETIARTSAPTEMSEINTEILGGEAEIPRSDRETTTEKYLYAPRSESPTAYLPSIYDSSVSTLVETRTDNQIEFTGLYYAPDKYICSLCGLDDLYVKKLI